MVHKKRKCLSLQTKIDIRFVDKSQMQKKRKCKIAKIFGISENSLSMILNNNSDLLKKYHETFIAVIKNDFVS